MNTCWTLIEKKTCKQTRNSLKILLLKEDNMICRFRGKFVVGIKQLIDILRSSASIFSNHLIKYFDSRLPMEKSEWFPLFKRNAWQMRKL